jgi:hypothetical protein
MKSASVSAAHDPKIPQRRRVSGWNGIQIVNGGVAFHSAAHFPEPPDGPEHHLPAGLLIDEEKTGSDRIAERNVC